MFCYFMILNFNLNNNIWFNYSLQKTKNIDVINYNLIDDNHFDYKKFQNIFNLDYIALDMEKNNYLLNNMWSESLKSSNILVNGSDDFFYFSFFILNLFSIFTLFLCGIFFLSSFYERYMSYFFKKLLNLVNTFIVNCLSYYEIISILSSYLVISVFFFVLAIEDEDISDMLFLLIFVFLVFLLYGLLFSLGFIKCYFFLNSNNSGYVFRKKISDDIINFILSLLRIFVCWIRYIFYDLQVDFIDMLLLYTEDINFEIYESNFNLNFFYNILAIVLDLILYTLLVIMCLVKLSIASFLMWLIIDLFLLRIGFFVSESWLINSIKSILLSSIKINK